MTGQKNRYSTQESLFGIEDKQLATPKHDELVLMLLNKTYSINAFKPLKDWIHSDTFGIRYFYCEGFEKDFNVFESNNGSFPQSYKRQSPISIEDMTTIYNLYANVDNNQPKIKMDSLRLLSEVPIKSKTSFIIGYWDVVISTTSDTEDFSYFTNPVPREPAISNHIVPSISVIESNLKPLYIECKPQIDSFGTTLRQLNTYKNYIPQHHQDSIYLFTPDLRFKDAFESQGIHLISPNIEGR